MARRFNGGLIGLLNAPRTGAITGIWTQNEVSLKNIEGTWPNPLTAVQIFTNSSTWTVPTGVSSVDYLVVGGAGSGGTLGGGGGAGGYQAGTGLSVIPATTYTIAVGAGGTIKYQSLLCILELKTKIAPT